MHRALCAALLLAAVTTGACVSHPVGPARTFSKYEGKAVTTAEGVLSAVNTARLMARTASAKKGYGPFFDAVASESEDAASGLEGTFASIQPPDRRADRLRRELDGIIAEAVDHLAALRVTLRRGNHAGAAAAARPLHDDAEKLATFIDEHRR